VTFLSVVITGSQRVIEDDRGLCRRWHGRAKGPLPVAVMVWPGAVAVRAATEMLTSGTYDSVADGIAYGTMNDAITAAP
jgi:hypothetical protein